MGRIALKAPFLNLSIALLFEVVASENKQSGWYVFFSSQIYRWRSTI